MEFEDRAIEVRSTRKAQGMTQQELADKAGVSLRTLGTLEAGKDVAPATVASVYNALGLRVPVPSWPEDVDAFLLMVGYHLSRKEPEQRIGLILAITRLLVGTP